MMPVEVDRVAPQRWKNGGGWTRELLAWPDAAGWRVRVSVADVEADGPFSAFPGVERWFAVLKGAGVALTVGGRTQRLTRIDPPLVFDGGAPASCRLLDGPTRDLNLMLRGARGGLSVAEDGVPWAPQAAMAGLFSAVAGRCAGLDLPAYALLWFEAAPPELVFEAGERPAGLVGWWLAATPVGTEPA